MIFSVWAGVVRDASLRFFMSKRYINTKNALLHAFFLKNICTVLKIILSLHCQTEIRGYMKMTVRQVIKMLEADGWFYIKTKGDHHQFKHPTKPGKVTVRGKASDDLGDFLIISIKKQAGLK